MIRSAIRKTLLFLEDATQYPLRRWLRTLKWRQSGHRRHALDFRTKFIKTFDREIRSNRSIQTFLRTVSLYDFLSYYISWPHYEVPFRGKLMSKLPMDYWVYRDSIERQSPEIILEIGTQRGVSALLFAELGQRVGATVITVDTLKPTHQILEEFKKEHIIFIHGDITQEETIAAVKNLIEGKNVYVVDDGSHRVDHILSAFNSFSPFVPLNGYYIIEDAFASVIIGEVGNNDTMSAVEAILDKRTGWWRRSTIYDQFMLFSGFQGILQRFR